MISRAEDMAPFLVPLGARVRELRHARGMSLGELERASGVWKGSLSLIERGKVNLTVRTCVRIARGLGVGMGELFAVEGVSERGGV